jgi:hypothetical protein
VAADATDASAGQPPASTTSENQFELFFDVWGQMSK